MNTHKTATREQWLAARLQLLEAEKALTRRSDEVARQRQALPWVRLDKAYRFDTDSGSATLAELFQDSVLQNHASFAGKRTLSIVQMLFQERPGSFVDRILQDLLRSPLFYYNPAVHKDDPVCNFTCKAHFMSDDQHCHVLCSELFHDQVDLFDKFRVQCRCSLIEQHDFWLHRQCSCYCNALLLSARQARRILIDFVGQSNF